MAEALQEGNGTIYPVSCLRASPTYWKWVKLTLADVHALRQERGFEAHDIYFHLNHPIRFVYLCGTIAGFHYFNRFVLMVLDDGSGQTIELKLEADLVPSQQLGDRTQIGQACRHEETEAADQVIQGTNHHLPMPKSVPQKISTEVPGVFLATKCADKQCYATHVEIKGGSLEIGTTVFAKGALSRFRGTYQVCLNRLTLVPGVKNEMEHWREYAAFVRRVLARPWILSDNQVQTLEQQAREREEIEREHADELAWKRRKIEDKKAAKRTQWLTYNEQDAERRERWREREEQVFNGNALDKPRKNTNTGPR